MTFEEAIQSLGAELGFEPESEGDAVSFEVAAAEDDDGFEFTISAAGDDMAVLCADVGELPAGERDAAMMEMLEANHLFAGTGGAAFSVEDGRVRLEKRVALHELGRGEGANVVKPFLALAAQWRARAVGTPA